tara:strand:+ start:3142 stop:4029 length:888 start_codon:yes stop_codon:yes gene_type:complete
MKCLTCNSQEGQTIISVYKRKWHICPSCGSAWTKKKSRYLFSYLPYTALKKNTNVNESTSYDYFIDEYHIGWSKDDGEELYKRYVKPYIPDLKDKKILDISGGNGHAINRLAEEGAKVELTEINELALEYAKKTFNIPTYKYNLNSDNLVDIVDSNYDIIFNRACIMFCDDLPKLISNIYDLLNPGGFYIINNTIEPTLGIMTRTQYDEYSFHILRQPKLVIEDAKKVGLELVDQIDEVDPSLYVYDNDLRYSWMFVHYFYEIRNTLHLKKTIGNLFNLRARDRRRSTLILRKPK